MQKESIENIIKHHAKLDNLYKNYLDARNKALEALNHGTPFEKTQPLWDEAFKNITEWQKLMKIKNDTNY
jgi:hypothetical protein